MTPADATRRAIENVNINGEAIEPYIGDDGLARCTGMACAAWLPCRDAHVEGAVCKPAVRASASLLARMLGETEAAG